MKRVYLSGPMSGIPLLNFPAFNAAAADLRSQGIEVVNPAEINPDHTLPWEACLRADIEALCRCSAIVLLPGWENSKGAQLELHVAHRLGLDVTLYRNEAQSVLSKMVDRLDVRCTELEEELEAAYAEMRRQNQSGAAFFDSSVWKRAFRAGEVAP